MSIEDIQKEIQHQKLHGMPSEPVPGKKGCLGKGFTILIIIIIIIAAIFLFIKFGESLF